MAQARAGAEGARWQRWPLELLSVVGLLLLWQALALIFPSRLFPGPVAVGAELVAQLSSGRLLVDLGRTLGRVAIAFGVAMVVGTALGIAIGRSRVLDRLAAPLLVVGLNLPAIVIAIVLYVWLGLTEFALILAVVLNKLPLVITTLREGVRSLSADYDELSRAFRLSPLRHLRVVLIPQVLPFLLAAARSGLSLIWKIVLVFEVLGSDGGVGFRISIFFQFFDIAGILSYTTAFILVVFAFELLVLRPLERRLFRWRLART